MFNQLSDRLAGIFDRLRGRGALSEADVTAALREIRIALLEADVALSVVKTFIEEVREKAIGQDVLKSVTPGQMVVKIVHDHLIALLDHPDSALNLAATPPVVILFVGLQGSGKTTMTAKLAYLLSQKENKKVLMASLDVYRPAAQKQLEVLGQSIRVNSLPIIPEEKPAAITKRALQTARLEGYDILLLDTAGRLSIDAPLMEELDTIKALSKPQEILFVADAMTGQDAVNVAATFHERLNLTGIALSRIDGDARGGAALSIRAVTGRPLKFLGTGEKPEHVERFHAERIAGRILGMGDIVSLVEKAAESIDRDEMEKMTARLQKGTFTLDDMASQMKQLTKMGGMGTLLNFLPGMGQIKEKLTENDMAEKLIKHQTAIISSMTRQERIKPQILNASRKRRIAVGCGRPVQEINRLLKQYEQMSTMMKRMGKMGQKGLLRQGIKGLFQR